MAVNEVRSHFINFECYYEGARKLGMTDITLSVIKMKTQSVAGAGIAGEIEMSTRGLTESMEFDIKWRTQNEDVTQLLSHRAHDLSFYGANEQYDAGTGLFRIEQHIIDVRGIPKEVNLGKFEPSSTVDDETKLEVIYLKHSIDGVKKIEIDKLNYIFYVNGTDYLADVRTALGL